MRLPQILTLLLALLPLAAFGHGFWIEPATDTTALFLRFGEYENNLREKSPGVLDKQPAPTGLVLDSAGAAQPASLTLASDGFRFGASAKTAAAVINTGEVRDLTKYGYGIVKPAYYARFAAQWPAASDQNALAGLDLDLVPLSGGRVEVLLHGKPLVGAKVLVIAPNGWSREPDAESKDSARFSIPTPWPGLYVIEVTHAESTPGEYRGKAYASIRHRATLALQVSK